MTLKMKPPPREPELLTVPEAALLLQCSTRTLFRLIATGEGPPVVRLGTLVRIDRAKLRDWIDRLSASGNGA